MKNELIRLHSIHAAENNSILRGADFKIYKGEAVGLVGGFHSGKMLLMEVIAGTYIPDQGYRFIHGKSVGWKGKTMELQVKHLKKNFGLIGPMTVWENIATCRHEEKWFSGIIAPERLREQVQKMLALYGIDADSGITVDRLTSIQRFAVALIKARLEGVELILAENSELEYSMSGFRLMQRILKLCREQGMSVMFSGIEAGGFSPLLDRICLIDSGRIIWVEQVRESPLPEAVSACSAMPVRLNIPVERCPLNGGVLQPVEIKGKRFSITGGKGQFYMLIDPEQALRGVFPDSCVQASSFSEERSGCRIHTAPVRQIDFLHFDRLVKWMSPADNLIFGLSSKIGGFGIIKPHLKRYLLWEFVKWAGDEKYLEMRDCESLVIGERIKIAAFRLKINKPDVVVFRNFQLLDQDSRAVVLSVMADLLRAGTALVGISSLDNFADFADGYFLIMNGGCSGKMDYLHIRTVLDGNGERNV